MARMIDGAAADGGDLRPAGARALLRRAVTTAPDGDSDEALRDHVGAHDLPDLPPGRDLRDRLGRRRRAARRGPRGDPRRRRLGDADGAARQHQRADDRDRRAGRRPDQGRDAAAGRGRGGAAGRRLDSAAAMARDFYASPFGVAYAAYMERPQVVRWVARTVWAGDTRPYYESMARGRPRCPTGGTIVDCPCGAGPALRALDRDRGVRYIGADLSPAMLRRIRKRAATRGLDGLELHEADADGPAARGRDRRPLPLLLGPALLRGPAAAMVEAARVMKPGGRMVGASFVHSARHPQAAAADPPRPRRLRPDGDRG